MVTPRTIVVCLLLLLDRAAPALPTLPISRAPAAAISSRSLVRSESASSTLSVARNFFEDALAPAVGALSGAMPFLTVDPANNTLTLEPAAWQALATMPAPVCVLSVAGAAHEGKSSLLNMFSHWINERWATVQGAGDDFKVAASLFDGGTDGAWLRVFTGKDGPLPGTECRSLALIDAPGASNALSLDADDTADAGAHRLFTLSTLASSTVALNVMTPVINQLNQLAPMLRATKRSLMSAFNEFTLADLPGLVVVARDVPDPLTTASSTSAASASPTPPASASQTAPPPPPASAAQSLEMAQLEYAMLMPRGDGLDATKKTLRTLFPIDRALVQLGMPDASDLDALSRGEDPPAHTIPGLPLSGMRPFYASFDAAASATVRALRPKSLGGHPLPGRVLADSILSLVDTVNNDAVPSLQKAVYASLDTQANNAVAAGVRSGIDALKDALLPTLAELPHQGADAPAPPRPRATTANGQVLTPSLLEATLANATEVAYDEFLRHAPVFGVDGAGSTEPAAWLQPYANALLREMHAITEEATSAMSRARHFEAAVEARVQQRMRAEAQAQAQLTAALHKREDDLAEAKAGAKSRAAHSGSGHARKLLTGLALLLLSAGATGLSAALLPPSAIVGALSPLAAQLTPLLSSIQPAAASVAAPIASQGPTVLAMFGLYRVTKTPVARAVGAAVGNVRAAFGRANAWLQTNMQPAPDMAYVHVM